MYTFFISRAARESYETQLAERRVGNKLITQTKFARIYYDGDDYATT